MAFGTRAGVGQDKVPVLQRRGCDAESTMSCWRVRRRSERGEEVRVLGGEQGALDCFAQGLRMMNAMRIT